MKKLTLSLIAIAVIFISGLSLAQVSSSGEKLDNRIDNQGYWKEAAERGLTQPNPVIPVPAAIYRGDQIRAVTVITENSPDVAVITGATSQSENSIFVDPMNNETVINSNNSTSTPGGGLTLYGANDLYSFDSGETWDGELQGAGGSNQGDPAALIGRNGRWYIGYIKNNGQYVSYSDNQGNTWASVKVADAPAGFGNLLDKNHMWIDNSPTSSYEGYLYNAWTTFGGSNNNDIEISVSGTDGETWSTPINVSNNLNAGSHCQGVNITTGPNGEAYALFAIYDNWPSDEDALALARSLDGGQTWESFRILDNIRGIRTSETGKNMRVNSFPCITADISSGPNRGNLYAVWANIGVPGVNTGSDIDVYMIRSEDGGDTWSTPVRVNQDPSGLGKQHYFPWIDCDPVSGTLSCVFYDDRNVSSSQCEVFCAVSYDAGETWEDFQVSDVSFTPTPIPGLASGYFGDYLGISSYGGQVYPVWTDNRTGTALTYVSPFTTSTMTAPTDLVASLEEETGVVDLNWEHPLGPTFSYFKIYRNLQFLGTTVFPTFTDTLPDYGGYRYIVTAYYSIEGESGGAIADVQWGNAQAAVDPVAVEESLLQGTTSIRYVDISNTGELPLEYQLNFTLPETSTDDTRAYCSGSGGCSEYIRRVVLGGIDNYSECGGYEDHTGLSTTLVGGLEYQLRVENGLSNQPTDICKVWIDWDQNTNFTDDTPVTLQGTPGTGPYTAVITVPEDAVNGPTRMRVRIVRGGTISPCGISQYGEVEDYTVNVVGWISAEPAEGTIAPGASEQVALTFDSGSLELGSYSIDLHVESNDPDNALITVPVTLNVVDVALVMNADKDSLCYGASTRIYANVTGGSGNPTYLWSSDPSGFSSTQQDPMVTPEVTTTYFVEVTDGSITLEDQITIAVEPLPDIDLGEDIAECEGGSATFNAGPGFATYLWSNGSNGSAITVEEPGQYWVEVSNSFGCVNRDTVEFLVYPLPPVDLGADASFCEGTSVALDAGDDFVSYAWSTGESSGEISVSQPGQYWVEVTDLNGCTAADTITLTMDPLPGATAITSGPASVDNFLSPVSDYTAETAQHATGYTWTLDPTAAGTVSNNGTTAQVSWTEGFTGPATLSVHATNDCGNGPVSQNLSVEVYTSQGLGEKAALTGMKVYPNPSDGNFTLEMTVNTPQDVEVRIMNSTGMSIIREKLRTETGEFRKEFNMSSLPGGIYSIAVMNMDGKVLWQESVIID